MLGEFHHFATGKQQKKANMMEVPPNWNEQGIVPRCPFRAAFLQAPVPSLITIDGRSEAIGIQGIPLIKSLEEMWSHQKSRILPYQNRSWKWERWQLREQCKFLLLFVSCVAALVHFSMGNAAFWVTGAFFWFVCFLTWLCSFLWRC